MREKRSKLKVYNQLMHKHQKTFKSLENGLYINGQVCSSSQLPDQLIVGCKYRYTQRLVVLLSILLASS